MKVTKKPLPSDLVREPITIKSKGEYARRSTTIFLVFALVVIGLTFVSEYTGRATTLNTATTVNITGSQNINCTFTLNSGLNMISLPCITNTQNRTAFFANSNTDVNTITAMYQYRNKQGDQWYVYNPNLPTWVVHDLTTLSREAGYLVYIGSGQSTVIEFEGILSSQSSFLLLQDNNLVGYPSLINDTLPHALTTINDTFLRVRYWNGTQYIEFNSTDGSLGLDNLTRYEGYWITMSTPDTWILSSNRT